MLSIEEKKSVIADVAHVASTAQSAIAAHYRGITVTELTALRKDARAAGVYLRVVKNTLAKRALEGTGFECISDSLKGPLILAFSAEDASAGARVINDFAKGNDKLEVKIVALSGKLLTPADIKALASMPTRDEAISRLMAVMKAPIEKLVRTMAEPTAKFVRTMAAVRDQKQV